VPLPLGRLHRKLRESPSSASQIVAGSDHLARLRSSVVAAMGLFLVSQTDSSLGLRSSSPPHVEWPSAPGSPRPGCTPPTSVHQRVAVPGADAEDCAGSGDRSPRSHSTRPRLSDALAGAGPASTILVYQRQSRLLQLEAQFVPRGPNSRVLSGVGTRPGCGSIARPKCRPAELVPRRRSRTCCQAPPAYGPVD
jgi:hypothetical protein